MLTRHSTELTDPGGGPITGGQVVPSHWRNSHQSGPMPLAGDRMPARGGTSTAWNLQYVLEATIAGPPNPGARLGSSPRPQDWKRRPRPSKHNKHFIQAPATARSSRLGAIRFNRHEPDRSVRFVAAERPGGRSRVVARRRHRCGQRPARACRRSCQWRSNPVTRRSPGSPSGRVRALAAGSALRAPPC